MLLGRDPPNTLLRVLLRQLERLLNEFPSRQLSHAIFPHPRSGRINIYQVMDFLLDHLLHHQQQMDRITRALRPSSSRLADAQA